MTINREASPQCQSQPSPTQPPSTTTTTPQTPGTTLPEPLHKQQQSQQLAQNTTPSQQIQQQQPQPRRKLSIGPIRRAHPASGATFNVQVVRGKMTSRCLWHAFRALILGMILMILGAGMATIGYYAVPLSTGQEVRGNSTVPVKNISRGYHLNNLSYIGPIVMGFGGFIVVAACVMTFEARDSAAKVVPARFKMNTNSAATGAGMGGGGGGSGRNNARNSSANRRTAGIPNGPPLAGGSQTSRWENNLGVFKASPAGDKVADRQALTAALIHFSRVMGSPGQSPQKIRRVSRSGSVPNLHGEYQSCSQISIHSPKASSKSSYANREHHHHHHNHHRRSSRHCSLTQRATREQYLHPGMLKYNRHALSVDESHPPPCLRPILSNNGSQLSVNSGGCLSPTLYSHDILRYVINGKRSDVSKRHVLSRQNPIEKDDLHSPRVGYHGGRRRSSTASDASMGSKHNIRRTSNASRTPSMESRNVSGLEGHSPETGIASSPRTSRRISAQLSTPSVEKEFRSQLSICSEPVATTKGLSCQSSIEPCVPEEDSPDQDEAAKTETTVDASANTNPPKEEFILKPRPDTLLLDCNLNETTGQRKYLARSSSSASFKKPKSVNQSTKSVDKSSEIYFISSASESNGDFDSIEVIDERRSNSFGQATGHKSANLHRLETVIYNENYLREEKSKSLQSENEESEEHETTTLVIQAEIENNNK